MSSQRIADDRYELERRIGHGGMATVYLARDRKLDRPVAIKILADNLAGDDDFRRRFMREARLAAKLDHPNVVQVFDVGEEEERPFIVMEHVDGRSLSELLGRRRRRLPPDKAVPLLAQVCEGLGHAHSRGLVHRDVKPGNLLLRDRDGQVKIVDFGIARAAEETRLTQTGRVMGTEHYMAPEQLADGRITPATDVYACGVVAREMLPSPPPPELAPVLERCLREDPRDRFSDATALCKELNRVQVADGAHTAATMMRRSRLRPAAGAGTEVTRRLSPMRAGERGTARARFPDLGAGLRLGLALLVAALIVVGLAIALSSDDGSPGGGETRVEPVPRSNDPAEQARALSQWLRDRAER